MVFSYCGNDTFSIESTERTMTIVLSTAFWSSGIKFLCKLQAIEEEEKDYNCRCGWKKPVRAKTKLESRGKFIYGIYTDISGFSL